ARRMVQVVPRVGSLAAPDSVPRGGEFDVGWDGNVSQFDELRLARPGADVGEALAQARIRLDTRRMRIAAPTEPGAYELRYFSSTEQKVVGTRPLAVVPAAVTLAVASEVAGGADFPVRWTGPGASADE